MLRYSIATLSTCAVLALAIASSPLELGIWAIFILILIILTATSVLPTWFSLILFLIYVGALLVIFAYFICIEPNHQLQLLVIIAISTVSAGCFFPWAHHINIPEGLDQIDVKSGLWLLLTRNIQCFTFLALVLFLVLVIVVKITTLFKGPLRPFKYVPTYPKNSPSNKNYK